MACLLAYLGSDNHLSFYFEKLYLFTYLSICEGGDCHPPIYLEGNGSTQHFKRGWSLPIYPPTHLLGDGHLYPIIWEGMVIYLPT